MKTTTRLSLLALIFALPFFVLGQRVAFDAAASAQGQSTSLSWSHTVGSGSNQILVVGANIQTLGLVASITYAGIPLKKAASKNDNGSVSSFAVVDAELWYLVNPPQGTNTVAMSITSTNRLMGGSVSFNNVDTLNPFTELDSAMGNSSSSLLNIKTDSLGMLIDVMTEGSAATTASAGTGQTQLWNRNFSIDGCGSTKNDTGATTMSWSWGISRSWVTVGGSLRYACSSILPAGISLFPTASICPGDSTTLTQVGGYLSAGAQWQWYEGSCGGTPLDTGETITITPTATTTYYVTYQGGGCSSTSCLSAIVTYVTPVTPIITGQLSLCGGQPDTLRFSNNPCPGGGCGYLWSTGLSALSLIVSPSVTTTYSVKDINTCGDTTSASFAVTVYPNQPTVVQNGDTLTSSDLTGTSYQWFINGTLIPGATSSSYVASQAGYYTVIIIDANGCKAPSDSVYVTNVDVNDLQFPVSCFRLFPNPNNGTFTISFNETIDRGMIKIFNMLGEEVFNSTVNGKQETIKSNLNAGIYFIWIEAESITYNNKLIIN